MSRPYLVLAASLTSFEYQNEPLSLLSVESLLLSPNTQLPVPEDEEFSFRLSGTAALSYTVDPARIAAALSGKTRTEAKIILDNYPEVDHAIITLRPFWRKTLPEIGRAHV